MKSMSNLYALGAVILWASLALSSARLAHLPPFLVLGVAFLIGALPALVSLRRAFVSWRVLLIGVAGYYGYHFFLFSALRLAPPVEANLINYLWPMLLVLLTPLFFKEARLRATHWFGAFVAFMGCVLLLGGQSTTMSETALWGYLCALGAAFTWPLYSLIMKRQGETSTLSIAGICLVSGLLCWPTHFIFEARVVPVSSDWPLLIWLGVGPFGVAFYLWDLALKKGDPRVVGALSYLTPVLSTLGLVLFTGARPGAPTWGALLLISLGAILGSLKSRGV